MNDMKSAIERKLTANVLMQKCADCEHIIFNDSWCSQERVLRFTTPLFRLLFAPKVEGKWNSGDFVMYEIHNDRDNFAINCAFDLSSLPREYTANRDKCLTACEATPVDDVKTVVLKSWNFAPHDDTEDLFNAFDNFLNADLLEFERQLSLKMTEQPTIFTEGDKKISVSNKYERNAKARQACIAAHGTVCKICGMDFGEKYGQDFSGIIEVHHIVPISQIGENYVVDPIHDLIPVCPNCHAALHSKRDGVYTIEELRLAIKDIH